MIGQSHQLDQSLLNNQKKSKHYNQNHIDGSGFFDSLLFMWMYPFLSQVTKQGVHPYLFPSLPQHLTTKTKHIQLFKYFKQFKNMTENNGLKLAKSLYITFKLQLIQIFILVIIVSLLKMYAPFLCAQIIDYIQNKSVRTGTEGIIFFIAIILLLFFRNIGQAQLNYRLGILGISISSNLSMLVFTKSLSYPQLRQSKFSIAQIINYSQVDSERMTYLGNQMSALLSTPLQIIIGSILMSLFIGISFLSGILMMIIMIVITYFVSKKTIKYNSEVLKAKDKRMKQTQAMLESIRFIKINVLQQIFLKRVDSARRVQIEKCKKKGLFQVIGFFVYWLASPIILSSTFITYIILGNQMKPQIAFTTIMIFAILQYPIRQLPTAFSEVIQMFASLSRIETYLNSPKIKFNQILAEKFNHDKQYSIKIENGNYKWSENKFQQNKPQKKIYKKYLKNINFEAKIASFTVIVGEIGSGKSSLLLSILNEMKASKNSLIKINGKIAYCAQKPWIMSATVQQNIILNEQYNPQKFNKIIYLSGLQRQIQSFPRGQLTQIGQKGVNISGGQKARISFARALYSQADIYLLDDILGAVDGPMATFLLSQAIQKYLIEKTVVLVTHSVQYAKFSHQVVEMKKGFIVYQGFYENMPKSRLLAIQQNIQTNKLNQKNQSQKNIDYQIKLIKQAITFKQKNSQQKDKAVTQHLVEELMISQDQQIGQIKPVIFRQYIDLNGGLCKFAFLIVAAMLLWIIFTTFASIVMEKWCQNAQQFQAGLYLYVGLSLVSSVFIFFRAYILILSGSRQGEAVHNKMIKSLLGANLTYFFNRIPTGRILNRLTKDLRQLDEAMGPAIGGLLVCVFQLMGTVAICIYSSTLFLLIPIIFVGYICLKVKNYYLNTQRQIARLQKVTNSPIVNSFVSALGGLQSMRAYKLQNSILIKHFQLSDINRKVRLIKQALQSWFALNLAYLSFVVNITAIGYCLFSGQGTPALAGLLITYALNLSSDINLSILCYAYFQTKVISLERIYSFMEIQNQNKIWGKQLLNSQQPTLQFKNVCIRYRMDLPEIVHNFNLKVQYGHKIGLVGDTGSGKSSIFNAILGIAHVSKGNLTLNKIPINQYQLHNLRANFTVLDQQTVILNGTLKFNLDPGNEHEDEELIDILKECQFYETIQDKGGILIEVKNDNFSVGEKQLICICRALLQDKKIILIDEATANIDFKTDQLMQKLLKTKLKGKTVITIAHRISTLQNCDKIIVMKNGEIVENGSRQELKQMKGIYYSMLHEAQKN